MYLFINKKINKFHENYSLFLVIYCQWNFIDSALFSRFGNKNTNKNLILPLTDSTVMTISTWVKFASLDSTPRTIISMDNSANKVSLSVTNNVSAVINAWNHVAITIQNYSPITWTLYVNKIAYPYDTST